MRLAMESDSLVHKLVQTKASVVVDLCKIYEQLKMMENERGPGVLHGQGILPKSRRILLGVISHMEIVTGGAAGASGILRKIFESSINTIAALHSGIMQPSPDLLFRICEDVLDLAAFSPSMVKTLFEFQPNETSTCLKAVTTKLLLDAGMIGYNGLSDSNYSLEVIFQVREN